LLGDFTALDHTGLKGIDNEPRIFAEQLPGKIDIDAQAVVFHFAEAASEAQQQASIGHVIEPERLFRHTHRIVPRQYDDLGTQLCALNLAGHKSQCLQRRG
jgi:hypothetical protein